MNPIEFPEANKVIAKDQPQYLPLPAHIADDDEGTTTFCWKLTLRERLKILFTGTLWHQVMTFRTALQPQRPSIDKPLLDTQ